MIPTNVHHVRLTTANLPAMVGWYARVFGMAPPRTASTPERAQTPTRLIAAWSSNHRANGRVTLLSLSATAVEAGQSRHRPLHIPLECATLEELLAAYARLKGVGIEPVVSIHDAASTAFYYEDPDHNVVELTLDGLDYSQKSNVDTRTPCKLGAQPISAFVDPEKMIAARAAGASDNELSHRAYAGEFPPSNPIVPLVLV
jgi:catechol 2,3-dioxygenase